MSTGAIPSQGTTLHIAGTSGTAKTITAISVGFPTILTSSAHGLTNGDSTAIAAIVGTVGTDATKGLNGKTLSITHVTTNTFAVEIDTTGLAYTSGGTATPSAWIKVGQVSDIKGTSDSTPDIDVSDLDSTTKEYLPGLPDTGNVSMTVYAAVDTDPGLAAIEAAFDARTTKTFKITYPKGSTPVRTFNAYAKSFPKVGDASKDGVVTGTIELKRSGSVTKS